MIGYILPLCNYTFPNLAGETVKKFHGRPLIISSDISGAGDFPLNFGAQLAFCAMKQVMTHQVGIGKPLLEA